MPYSFDKLKVIFYMNCHIDMIAGDTVLLRPSVALPGQIGKVPVECSTFFKALRFEPTVVNSQHEHSSSFVTFPRVQ